MTPEDELPEPDRLPEPAPRLASAQESPEVLLGRITSVPPPSPDPARLQLAEAVRTLSREASELGETLRQERAVERFVPVLTEWMPERCRELEREMLERDTRPGLPREYVQHANWLMMVLTEVRALVAARRDPHLLPMLGDADALAEKCYQPIVDFARAEGLPLSTARPVAQLTDFDLAIWTGFAPTSLAPIFLPQDFFSRVSWWPAIAHEIGHDFLISIPGLRDRLAAEIGLPGEDEGTLPLRMYGSQLDGSELWRVHGGWFEELFCDVFGTLMCGPAYVATMVELFAKQTHPSEVLLVPLDPQTGRYDLHPPRHLRVHAACAILERAGFHQDAKALLARWYQKNELDPEKGVPLLFWVQGQFVYLPFSAFEPLAKQIVERLYEGPFEALNGFGLTDISGLDYGPHEHAEAERAKAALLAGRVPGVRDARAVIAGAVLATLEQPAAEAQILARARKAIVGVGTFEHAPSAFDAADGVAATQRPGRAVRAGALELSPEALADAVVLREILERPGQRRAQRR